MAGTFDISTINIISPNGLVTKPLTVDNYGYASIGDERVGVTPTNWIINGQFDVWQRGTSQTSDGFGSDDRWKNQHFASTKTHSQQMFSIGQTDVPNNPTYYSRTIASSASTASCYVMNMQRVEDLAKLAGKIVTISFWAKADANKNMSISLAQGFGTGGSASVYFGIHKFALTTTWKKFTKTTIVPSISGKTVGLNNFTELALWFDAGSDFNAFTDSLGNQSGTFDIANVCLVEGSVPVECPNEPYAEVLRKCQRYYWRMTADIASTHFSSSAGFFNSTTNGLVDCQLPVQMRIPPTAIEYSSLALFDGASNIVPSSIAINSNSKNVVNMYGLVTGGTQFRPCFLLANNSTSAYLAFTAEL